MKDQREEKEQRESARTLDESGRKVLTGVRSHGQTIESLAAHAVSIEQRSEAGRNTITTQASRTESKDVETGRIKAQEKGQIRTERSTGKNTDTVTAVKTGMRYAESSKTNRKASAVIRRVLKSEHTSGTSAIKSEDSADYPASCIRTAVTDFPDQTNRLVKSERAETATALAQQVLARNARRNGRNRSSFKPHRDTSGSVSQGAPTGTAGFVKAGKAMKTAGSIGLAANTVARRVAAVPEDGVGFDDVTAPIRTKANRLIRKGATKVAGKSARAVGKTGRKAVRYKTASTIARGLKAAGKSVMVAVKASLAALKSLVALLWPYLLPVLGGGLAFILVIAVICTGGAARENSSLCGVGSDGTKEGNAQAIWSYVISKGVTPECAAGILGNLERESQLDPAAVEEGSGEGHGLVQWSFGRREQLLKAASEKGVDWTDLRFQLDFMYDEALKPGTYYHGLLKNEGFFDAETPLEAAVIWHDKYEVSADPPETVRRIRGGYAESWYTKLKGTDPDKGLYTDRVVWIGDSRTEGMKNTVDVKSDTVIAKSGAGYSWFEQTGVPEATAALKKGDTIVINMGVNDLHNNMKYVAKIHEMSTGDWKDHKICFMSVNPVDDSKSSYAKNNLIDNFNASMKKGLNPGIKYLDTNKSLEWDYFDAEGLHYDRDTYQRIWDKVHGVLTPQNSVCGSWGTGSVSGIPDFSKKHFWSSPLNSYPMGQCTWYAAGAALAIYGELDGWNMLGDGNMWVDSILSRYPDRFSYGAVNSVPKAGSIFSATSTNHVGVILQVDGDMVTYFDGNNNGFTDSWDVAVSNAEWQIATVSLEQLHSLYRPKYANPIEDVTKVAKQ